MTLQTIHIRSSLSPEDLYNGGNELPLGRFVFTNSKSPKPFIKESSGVVPSKFQASARPLAREFGDVSATFGDVQEGGVQMTDTASC